MDIKKVGWLTANCNSSITEQQYTHAYAANSAPSPLNVPYITIGAAGFDASNAEIVGTAYAAKTAVDMAKQAVTDPSKWTAASEAFDRLADRPPIPSSSGSDLVSGRLLDPTAVVDHAAKLSAACAVAAMYTEANFDNSIQTMEKMATLSHIARPHNIVDHRSVLSAYAVLSCTTALNSAQAAIDVEDDGESALSAAEKATQYQQHVAAAEQWYNLAHRTAVPNDVKVAFERAQKRINDTYSSTYPTILQSTVIQPVTAMALHVV